MAWRGLERNYWRPERDYPFGVVPAGGVERNYWRPERDYPFGVVPAGGVERNYWRPERDYPFGVVPAGGVERNYWRPERDSNPRMTVLQTVALPLRHPAKPWFLDSGVYGACQGFEPAHDGFAVLSGTYSLALRHPAKAETGIPAL